MLITQTPLTASQSIDNIDNIHSVLAVRAHSCHQDLPIFEQAPLKYINPKRFRWSSSVLHSAKIFPPVLCQFSETLSWFILHFAPHSTQTPWLETVTGLSVQFSARRGRGFRKYDMNESTRSITSFGFIPLILSIALHILCSLPMECFS